MVNRESSSVYSIYSSSYLSFLSSDFYKDWLEINEYCNIEELSILLFEDFSGGGGQLIWIAYFKIIIEQSQHDEELKILGITIILQNRWESEDEFNFLQDFFKI